MREGHRTLILFETREHFQENLLGEVLFGDPARQARADNANDDGVEMLHKFARSNLIVQAYAPKTANQIERLVTSPSLVASADEKRRLGAEGEAVEMESYAILAEAALSFLGVGVQPPTPSWGNIIAEGRDYATEAWWVMLFPGLGITSAALGLNLLGDGLRDILDPRLKGQG